MFHIKFIGGIKITVNSLINYGRLYNKWHYNNKVLSSLTDNLTVSSKGTERMLLISSPSTW